MSPRMLFAFLGAMALIGILGGCMEPQKAMDNRKMVCIDGVEYVTLYAGTNAGMMAQHVKRNGMPYTCGDTPDRFDPD